MTIVNTGKKTLDLHLEIGNTIMLRSSTTEEVHDYKIKGICKKMLGDLEGALVLDIERIEDIP